jgi:hypothetical protein
VPRPLDDAGSSILVPRPLEDAGADAFAGAGAVRNSDCADPPIVQGRAERKEIFSDGLPIKSREITRKNRQCKQDEAPSYLAREPVQNDVRSWRRWAVQTPSRVLQTANICLARVDVGWSVARNMRQSHDHGAADLTWKVQYQEFAEVGMTWLCLARTIPWHSRLQGMVAAGWKVTVVGYFQPSNVAGAISWLMNDNGLVLTMEEDSFSSIDFWSSFLGQLCATSN